MFAISKISEITQFFLFVNLLNDFFKFKIIVEFKNIKCSLLLKYYLINYILLLILLKKI